MTPTATKRKSSDDQPQGGRNPKRPKLDTSDASGLGCGEQAAEEQQVAKPNSPPPRPASKRQKIRKLAPPRPFPTIPASASATGPRSARSEGKNYICVTRKTPLAAYLRRCKELILDDGYKSLHLSAMGAAIPICLTLVESLPDILPHGSDRFRTEISTGTVQVRDEIIPEDDDEDMSYAIRSKSTVTVIFVVEDGANEMRPAKRHAAHGEKRHKKKGNKKHEIVLSEPDQDDMDVV